MDGRRLVISVAVGLALLAAVGVPFVALGDQQGVTYPRVTPDRPAAASAPARAERPGRARGNRVARAASLRAASRTTLIAPLLGRNEVSPDTGRRRAGDLDGKGVASVVMKDGELCFAVSVQGIDDPVGLHVHEGRNNRNGDIVVTLTPPGSGDPGASAGCVEIAPSLARQIERRPRAFYVNIHTEDFPAGALRGQLRRAPLG